VIATGGDDVERRLAAVRARIDAAAEGRSVLLVAVSKGQSVDAIRAAYGAGQRDFGENYVQELGAKAAALTELAEIRFHLIGHLQRNKVRHAIRLVQAVHSVDSLALADELDRRAEGLAIPPARRVFGQDPRLPVFAEVSIAGESQKSGILPGQLGELLEHIERKPMLRLVGLMTVPPLDEEATTARRHFEALGRLRDEQGGPARLPELSMGMTADFEQALAAGATVVRIGSAIFGPRARRLQGDG